MQTPLYSGNISISILSLINVPRMELKYVMIQLGKLVYPSIFLYHINSQSIKVTVYAEIFEGRKIYTFCCKLAGREKYLSSKRSSGLKKQCMYLTL